MGQGQIRVIIYINFVELEYIMLHAKFNDHRTINSSDSEFRNIPVPDRFRNRQTVLFREKRKKSVRKLTFFQ